MPDPDIEKIARETACEVFNRDLTLEETHHFILQALEQVRAASDKRAAPPTTEGDER